MKPEVQMYFTDPADLSKKYHSQLSQVMKNIPKSAYFTNGLLHLISNLYRSLSNPVEDNKILSP